MKFFKKILSFVFSRAFLIVLGFILEIILFIAIVNYFSDQFVWVFALHYVLSIITTIFIINKDLLPEYKISWLLPVFFIPVYGCIFFFLFSENRIMRKVRKSMNAVSIRLKESQTSHEEILESLDPSTTAYHQSRYLTEYGHSPIYENSVTTFYPTGEDYFKDLVEELKKAERFIFLEFFIIERGYMWDTILEILRDKVKKGVDVRIIYDDFGCLTKLPRNYEKKLSSYGIKVHVFNPILLFVMPKHNNRDHRKIVVIDGYVGFTGGINLADEYINKVKRFGTWKDSAVRLTGEAVYSLTTMFLSLWSHYEESTEPFESFLPSALSVPVQHQGYVQPFNDSPLDSEAVCETVYLNAINAAKKYVYITTPYLILSRELENALCNVAKAGIDVRIITPHIPDKKIVFMVTRSYYKRLIHAGVQIYEYTPGFIHAKNLVIDDEFAVVGTINMDFRSMYLHFECGVWMYESPAVKDIYDDFINTLEVSRETTKEDIDNIPFFKGMFISVMQLFAPFM
ncbi:MAG: cardiolipin synthase [Gallicola sp.]|nr:cardiolipin synthase [Gallicola sp.]